MLMSRREASLAEAHLNSRSAQDRAKVNSRLLERLKKVSPEWLEERLDQIDPCALGMSAVEFNEIRRGLLVQAHC